jgi:ubiquinone/menaquinone biosynthesis C-methylase UbiE
VSPAGIELTLEAEKYVSFLPEDRILSVGCGTGEMEEYLRLKYGSSVVGIDIRSEAIRIAKEKRVDGLDFVFGDAEALPFDSESFTAVYSCGALASFFENGSREIERVLAPGGKVILIEATYMDGAVSAKDLQAWSGKSRILPDLLQLRQTVDGFIRLGFRTIVTRLYFQPSWWEVYFQSVDEKELQAEREVYERNRREIGIGLFVFEKIPATEFQI